jgi:hypothetical protein
MIERSGIMIYQNIFSKKPEIKTSRLHLETEDFDYTHRLLENESILEDNFFDIMRDQIMVTHLALKESSVEILQEGFGDFINSAVEFFKKMLARFKEFMTKIFMYLHAYMGNFEKFLTKYRDTLRNLEPDFQIEGYEYSLRSDVPKLDKLKNIVSTYNNELSEIDKLTKADVIKKRREYLSSETLDAVRGHIIGSSTPVISEDYLATVKRTFRNGADKSEMIQVNKTRLLKAIEDYDVLKKFKKECEQEREKTIRLVESIQDFFNRSAAVHYKGDKKVMYMHNVQINHTGDKAQTSGDRQDVDYNGSRMEAINLFFSLKFVEAKEIGSMATTASIEKVHALKEAINLTQTIIRKSLGFKKSPEEVTGLSKGGVL